MKVDRYKMHPRFDAVELVIDPDGSVCYTRDVAKLEAMNAELVEALTEIITQTDGRNHYVIGHDRAYAIARAAIAKAKGEGV